MRAGLVLVCTLAAAATGADPPYLGQWKLNLGKSDFSQITMTLESLPGGAWQATEFGISRRFQMDGKQYPDEMGGTVAWRQTGSHTWEAIRRANGKVNEMDAFRLSADGNTLMEAVNQRKADFGPLDSAIVYERVSGGASLAGKWRVKKVSGGARSIEFVVAGDGLRFHDLEMDISCDWKMDGTDYPCSGPTIPPGYTAAVKSGGRALDLTVKKDGKPFWNATCTVSADGKTLTADAGAIGTGEKMKIVFDRMQAAR